MATPTQTQTNVVPLDSELRRKGWLLEGLLQAKATSLFAGFRGTSSDAVIFVKSDLSKGAGHEVIFQFDGKVTGAAKRGKARLRGNEEQKKLFSDKIRVERLRHGLDNGDEFDAIEVNNLNTSTHGNSRGLLANWYIEQRDQAIIDAGQGFLNSEAQTHIIRPNNRATSGAVTSADVMSYDFILDTEQKIKDGMGFAADSKTQTRQPLEAYAMADGQKKFIWFIDSSIARQMRQDTEMKSILTGGDVRGADNSLIKGVVASFGIFLFVELPTYMGTVEDRGMYGTEVEVCGMRRYNANQDKFAGEDGFKGTTNDVMTMKSFIVGKKAFQEAFGKMPDYKFKSSDDYDIDTGSAIELYAKTQKCILAAENEDYNEAVVAGYNYGLIGVETYHSTVA